jgi:hypothetical protein
MKPVENLNLFPVLVRKIPNFLSKDECNKIISKLNMFNFDAHDALRGDARSSHWNTIIGDETTASSKYALNVVDAYVPINQRVLDCVNSYVDDMGVSRVTLGNSWINIQGPESELFPHTHPRSAISGALYIKADSESSSINFHNPNPYIDIFDIKQWTVNTFKSVYIAPNAGDLLLFPSWLKHGSYGVNKSTQRIVLSFNTNYVALK